MPELLLPAAHTTAAVSAVEERAGEETIDGLQERGTTWSGQKWWLGRVSAAGRSPDGLFVGGGQPPGDAGLRRGPLSDVVKSLSMFIEMTEQEALE